MADAGVASGVGPGASGVGPGGEGSIAPRNGENSLFTVDLDGRGTQEGIFLRTLWTSWREVPQRKKIRPYFAKSRALPHNSRFTPSPMISMDLYKFTELHNKALQCEKKQKPNRSG
jgi:hypothetical protein